jgi:RNA polymerase sigma factor (sigma-70 family)
MTTDIAAAHRAVDAVWRIESARIIAGLARLVRDVGLAEELAQDALVAALEQWPAEGIPAKPGAWLMLTARHRAIDRIRREERFAGKLTLLGRELAAEQGGTPAEFEAAGDDERIDDDLLRLMFISCHPVLSTQARVVLTLRLLGGLTTEEIARGLLTTEPTIAKRITRAKRTLASSQVPFEVPPAEDRPARLASVLEASRIPARLGPDGLPVPLPEQNHGRWDHLLIRRGFTALLRAQQLRRPPGPYVLQAAIAACHARARTGAETDWRQISLLYEALAVLTPSPVVELNRAVAVAMAGDTEAGLRITEELAAGAELAGYHHLPSVRGDLLARLGQYGQAAGEFRRAAALTKNNPERTMLLRRADDCDAQRQRRGDLSP